jgi:hypothetical protein
MLPRKIVYPSGAAAVVDDDLLADGLRERLAYGTRQEIVSAAGRKRHDHPDRSCRIFGGEDGLNTDAEQQRGDDEYHCGFFHFPSSFTF